ncbi:uncharacterized protein F5147DRAFT_650340 [Suillus discolor]|uniref:Prenyltransferase alpha-alpha toroid domain-containing protein n=1 Tax=Suillus discolor TaxID=1912936 RepID=A0A9P7JWW6_9AGAM|nr:uncharacterized protein F5147DRAFT_650340 [Suillus discolor]KAG2113395.1 hypothetical protein F5147DRAFT_650340 [Suillus discolor]
MPLKGRKRLSADLHDLHTTCPSDLDKGTWSAQSFRAGDDDGSVEFDLIESRDRTRIVMHLLYSGGSICMDLLLTSAACIDMYPGWLPGYNIASVLLQIKLAISSTSPKPARLAQDWEQNRALILVKTVSSTGGVVSVYENGSYPWLEVPQLFVPHAELTCIDTVAQLMDPIINQFHDIAQQLAAQADTIEREKTQQISVQRDFDRSQSENEKRIGELQQEIQEIWANAKENYSSILKLKRRTTYRGDAQDQLDTAANYVWSRLPPADQAQLSLDIPKIILDTSEDSICRLGNEIAHLEVTMSAIEDEDLSDGEHESLVRILDPRLDVYLVEIELGGFRGRTNKLVDGCYSWWVGGCFALLSSLGIVGAHGRDDNHQSSTAHEEDESWDDIDDSLWDRAALQRYILCAGQHPAGGLRDKPPKAADSYHTLYCLAGLSAAQHNVFLSSTRQDAIVHGWRTPVEEEGTSRVLGAQNNRMVIFCANFDAPSDLSRFYAECDTSGIQSNDDTHGGYDGAFL